MFPVTCRVNWKGTIFPLVFSGARCMYAEGDKNKIRHVWIQIKFYLCKPVGIWKPGCSAGWSKEGYEWKVDKSLLISKQRTIGGEGWGTCQIFARLGKTTGRVCCHSCKWAIFVHNIHGWNIVSLTSLALMTICKVRKKFSLSSSASSWCTEDFFSFSPTYHIFLYFSWVFFPSEVGTPIIQFYITALHFFNSLLARENGQVQSGENIFFVVLFPLLIFKNAFMMSMNWSK